MRSAKSWALRWEHWLKVITLRNISRISAATTRTPWGRHILDTSSTLFSTQINRSPVPLRLLQERPKRPSRGFHRESCGLILPGDSFGYTGAQKVDNSAERSTAVQPLSRGTSAGGAPTWQPKMHRSSTHRYSAATPRTYPLNPGSANLHTPPPPSPCGPGKWLLRPLRAGFSAPSELRRDKTSSRVRKVCFTCFQAFPAPLLC
ncbi:hypothetical protein LEMLEM_LOCUS2266 [Lemmus lemmus]